MISILDCLIQLTRNLTDVNLDEESTERLLDISLSWFNCYFPFTCFTFEDDEFCIFFSNVLVLYAAYMYWKENKDLVKADYYLKQWENYIQVKDTDSFKKYCDEAGKIIYKGG